MAHNISAAEQARIDSQDNMRRWKALRDFYRGLPTSYPYLIREQDDIIAEAMRKIREAEEEKNNLTLQRAKAPDEEVRYQRMIDAAREAERRANEVVAVGRAKKSTIAKLMDAHTRIKELEGLLAQVTAAKAEENRPTEVQASWSEAVDRTGDFSG